MENHFYRSGHNYQGNYFNTAGGTNSKVGKSYYYSNNDGSFYYKNDNGSSFYQDRYGNYSYTRGYNPTNRTKFSRRNKY